MWPYYPELLDTPVPRYTSYPTAAEFGDAVGAEGHCRALEGAGGDVSLYLHIPFCEKICWYCGCNTGAANRRARMESYLDSLHREIALVGSRLPASARVRRIAFGGGSPNAMSPVDFVRLMNALLVHFRLDNPVISIELDPRGLTPAWGTALRGIGATHASLGVQTFAPHLQKAIGRLQPAERIEECTQLLREAGIRSLNFDLMYGLPGQSLDDLTDTIDRASALGADRIALFGYAHVPHLIPRQRRIDATALPSPHARFVMAAVGHERLADDGYVAVGFDHFARPGDPLAQAILSGRLHRNFQGFTDDSAPTLIGLGASAISSFPTLLAQNEKNNGRYGMLLSQDRLPVTRGIVRTPEDQRRGAVIEQLLCQGRATIDTSMACEAMPGLAPYVEAGLCEFDGRALVVHSSGLPYARSIAAQFDPYRRQSGRRFSSAV